MIFAIINQPSSQTSVLHIMQPYQQCMNWEYLQRVPQFLLYTATIYTCYITSGLYHEKILKYAYPHDANDTTAYFDAPIVFTIFPPFICTLIGYAHQLYQTRIKQEPTVNLPFKKAALCSLIINVNMWTYNQAIVEASFPAVVMVKSCSLLSVILVGIFCSGVKDKTLKLGKKKILIGTIVTVGIFLFNYFNSQVKGNNRPLSIFSISSLLLLISLLGDGFLPDVQASIKAEYKPGSMDLYLHINKYTCVLSFLWTVVTLKTVYIFDFMVNSAQLRQDLLCYSLLNAVGQLVIYRMIKLFKQHIPAFVIATRKCFTVLVNISHFGHETNALQGIGIVMVFTAVLMEVYDNYREKVEKETGEKPLTLSVDMEKIKLADGGQEDGDGTSKQVQTK